MVRLSKLFVSRRFSEARAERARIERGIARDIESMNETTMATRERIADCRQALRKADRLLKRE